MSLSSKLDKRIAKYESDAERHKKKNCTPEKYNDPVKDTLVTQGKGGKYRDIDGWYSDEITERLRKIFGKKKTK